MLPYVSNSEFFEVEKEFVQCFPHITFTDIYHNLYLMDTFLVHIYIIQVAISNSKLLIGFGTE